MKKYILLMITSLCAITMVSAQEVNEKQLTKKERKAIEKRNREIKDSLAHLDALAALQDGNYVLMADRIMIRSHAFMNPAPNTNFVLVQGDKAVIQLASNNGRAGLNGMGGITVEGYINGLKCDTNKKGETSYKFGVSGPALSAQVHIVLYKEDNQAMAIVSPNYWSGNLTVYGKIFPYKKNEYDKAIQGNSFP